MEDEENIDDDEIQNSDKINDFSAILNDYNHSNLSFCNNQEPNQEIVLVDVEPP